MNAIVAPFDIAWIAIINREILPDPFYFSFQFLQVKTSMLLDSVQVQV